MAMPPKKRYMFKVKVYDFFDELEGKDVYYTNYGYIDSRTEGEALEILSTCYCNGLAEIHLTPLKDGFVCLMSENMYNEILESNRIYG